MFLTINDNTYICITVALHQYLLTYLQPSDCFSFLIIFPLIFKLAFPLENLNHEINVCT